MPTLQETLKQRQAAQATEQARQAATAPMIPTPAPPTGILAAIRSAYQTVTGRQDAPRQAAPEQAPAELQRRKAIDAESRRTVTAGITLTGTKATQRAALHATHEQISLVQDLAHKIDRMSPAARTKFENTIAAKRTAGRQPDPAIDKAQTALARVNNPEWKPGDPRTITEAIERAPENSKYHIAKKEDMRDAAAQTSEQRTQADREDRRILMDPKRSSLSRESEDARTRIQARQEVDKLERQMGINPGGQTRERPARSSPDRAGGDRSQGLPPPPAVPPNRASGYADRLSQSQSQTREAPGR